MANNYSYFDEIMNKLIRGRENDTDGILSVDNFCGNSLGELQAHQDEFWAGLLQYLQNEPDEDKLNGEYGLRQYEFSKFNQLGENHKTTILEYITDNIDMISSFMESVFHQNPTHWNESYAKLVENYWQMFVNNNREIDHTYISLAEIEWANAGHSFSDNGYWVNPWSNSDFVGETTTHQNYGYVRDKDKIIRVLSDPSHMQFTNEFVTMAHKYIRLLMPMYERSVEIEDLNRNFWVIGQVLTGICSFLFDSESPFRKMFEGLADEIGQLWENLLYLWIAFTLLAQKQYKEQPAVLVVPVGSTQFEEFTKRDGFFNIENWREAGTDLPGWSYIENRNLEELLEICDGLTENVKHMYPNTNLIIIPEIRYCPYAHDYYAASMYPGIIVHSRTCPNHDTTSYYPLLFEVSNVFTHFIVSPERGASHKAVVGPHVFTNNPFGFYERGSKYHFINDMRGGATGSYYIGGMRTTFSNASAAFNDRGQLTTFSIDCKVYDIGKILNGQSEADSTMFSGNFLGLANGGQDYPASIVCRPVFNDIAVSLTDSELEIEKGWYRGEMPSWVVSK